MGKPVDEQHIEFMDLACGLKGVSFKNSTQEELLAFWLNVYHCLLIYGRMLLGVPKSKTELGRFYDRVSFIVGLRPVSLRDIERFILRVPCAGDRAVEVYTTGRAHARQLMARCCCLWRRPPHEPASDTIVAGVPSSPRAGDSPPKRGVASVP